MTITHLQTPLGTIRITGDATGVSAISCLDGPTNGSITEVLPEPVEQAVTQLNEYFAGNRRTFDFPMTPVGTTFQRAVWRALRSVPFGTTQSYLTLTRSIGDVKAIRAVAAANGRNPLAIVVPCHRIIGSDGSLTGYAGGLWRKQWLLEHEGVRPKLGQMSLF